MLNNYIIFRFFFQRSLKIQLVKAPLVLNVHQKLVISNLPVHGNLIPGISNQLELLSIPENQWLMSLEQMSQVPASQNLICLNDSCTSWWWSQFVEYNLMNIQIVSDRWWSDDDDDDCDYYYDNVDIMIMMIMMMMIVIN